MIKEIPFTKIPNQLIKKELTPLKFALVVYILANAFKQNSIPISVTEFHTRIMNIKNKPVAKSTIKITLDELEKIKIININRGKFNKTKNNESRKEENEYSVNLSVIRSVKQEQPQENITNSKKGSSKPVNAKQEAEATAEEQLKEQALELLRKYNAPPQPMEKQEFIEVHLSENPYAVPFWKEKWKKSLKHPSFRIKKEWYTTLEKEKWKKPKILAVNIIEEELSRLYVLKEQCEEYIKTIPEGQVNTAIWEHNDCLDKIEQLEAELDDRKGKKNPLSKKLNGYRKREIENYEVLAVEPLKPFPKS